MTKIARMRTRRTRTRRNKKRFLTRSQMKTAEKFLTAD